VRKGLVGIVTFVALVGVVVGVVYWLTRPATVSADRPKAAPPQGSCWNVDTAAAAEAFPWPGSPVDCTGSHTAEVFHVGQVNRELAAKAASGKGDDAKITQNLMYGEARRACVVQAPAFLGGDWHAARVQVIANWIKPQRTGYFACAAVEATAPGSKRLVTRTASLRDALKSPGGLGITCVARQGADLAYSSCDGPHAGEYVGGYTVTPQGAPFVEEGVRATVASGCGNLAAEYIGAPRTDLRPAYVGPLSAGDWLGSDQTFACYAMATGAEVLSRSVKGLGTAPLPR
jgi:hypothetical protein